jgi:polyisoprenoid-binding protein YceI
MANAQITTNPQVVPAAGTYALDPTHSYVSFTARHLMVTKVRGRFPVTEGKLVVGEDPTASSVQASIDVTAVETGDPKRDEHLRSADFFDVEKHGEASFRSTSVENHGDGEFTLHGDLTIKGVTHAVTLQGEYLGTQASPWGDTRVGFSAETEINRSDYGVDFNAVLETGGVVVSDKIKLNIDAEWIAQ